MSPFTLEAVDKESWVDTGAWYLYGGIEFPKPTKGYYRFFEIFPPLDVEPDYRPLARSVIPDPNSLEIWWDGSQAKIVYACHDPVSLSPFQSSYEGVDFSELDRSEPEWLTELEEAPIFFDVEQLHGLSFCRFIEEHRGELLNHLIGSLSPDCKAWIQIVSVSYDWSLEAEKFSERMQTIFEQIRKGGTGVEWQGGEPTKYGMTLPTPKVKHGIPYSAGVRGSTIAEHGRHIANEAFAKGQLANAIFHIRGLIAGSGKTVNMLNSGITAGVKCSYDFVSLFPYSDVRLLRWLRGRACPTCDRFFSNLADGSFLNEWTVGYEDGKRTLIPVLCVVPREFAIFNCLPTERDLPVKYAEPKPISSSRM